MHKDTFLDQFYTVDSSTNQYIIEISIQNYDDIFNTWDSAIYNIRDLDASLKAFLEECSRDISLKYDVILRFNLRGGTKNKDVERDISAGIRNYFNYQIHVLKRNLHRIQQKIFGYSLLSVSLIITSLFLAKMGNGLMIKVLVEILTVGSWIFLWETFTFVFLRNGELYRRKHEYERLLKSSIVFRYNPA